MAEKNKKSKPKQSEDDWTGYGSNEFRTEHNRRMLQGGKDWKGEFTSKGDRWGGGTPELGQLGSERTLDVKMMPVLGKEHDYLSPMSRKKEAERKRKAKRAKGGYVKKYANGGSVRAARF